MLNKVWLQEYFFQWMLKNVLSEKEIFFGGVYDDQCWKVGWH